jgi:MFS family permease
VILLIGNSVSVVANLFGGWISDRIGRKAVLLISAFASIPGVTLFFLLAPGGNFGVILAIVVFTLAAVQFASGVMPAWFAEQFPTATRFSGAALSLSFATLIFASPTPLLAAALSQAGNGNVMLWIALASLVIGIICIFSFRESKNIDLTAYIDED